MIEHEQGQEKPAERLWELGDIYAFSNEQRFHPKLPTATDTLFHSGHFAMHLAPDFPDDHAMRQLMELLHEEIGLPERKTIRLDTAINLDLGCDGADARHLMEALEERFAIDLIDYDAYRYFQPEGFDVFQKRRAKGRGNKMPLTIGMLYKAIKAQRWDTREVEEA